MDSNLETNERKKDTIPRQIHELIVDKEKDESLPVSTRTPAPY